MRLLQLRDDGVFSLVEHVGNNIPPYAILSHTWGSDSEEVTYQDLLNGTGNNKKGYRKLTFCGKQAKIDGLRYFWVDTCCIDKSSSAELSEAINSMFYWYQNAARCYAYLSDVSVLDSSKSNLSSQQPWKQAFQNSRWFTRGWTLQELIAPALIEFFSKEEQRLGDKPSLEQTLSEITGIAIESLRGGTLSQLSIKERMSWAEGRQTKREEDEAYCLLGIFDIHMPLLYGEGRTKALLRLRRKIDKAFKHQLSVLPPSIPSTEQPNHKTIEEDSGPVISVGFLYGGGQIVVTLHSGAIRFWDWVKGECVRSLEGHTDVVEEVALSPDEKLIASASQDQTVKIWSMDTNNCLQTLKDHSRDVFSVAWSPNNKYIASGSRDKTIKIWDPKTGTILRTINEHTSAVHSVVFSYDSSQLLSGSWDATVGIWCIDTGCLVRRFRAGLPVDNLSLAPDGKHLATAGQRNTPRVWDLVTGKCVKKLEGHQQVSVSITFSHDGKLLATGSGNGDAKIWDASTGNCIWTLIGHTDSVNSIAFSIDDKFLATASFDGSIKIWETKLADTHGEPTFESNHEVLEKEHPETLISTPTPTYTANKPPN